jgi:hypothetical protein
MGPLSVENSGRGLAIYSAGGEGEGDQAEPIGGAAPPGAQGLDALKRRMAARQVNDRTRPELEHDQLQAMQAYLDQVYQPK